MVAVNRSVATLIAAEGALGEGAVRVALETLAAAGAEIVEPDWLAPATACDLGFSGVGKRRVATGLRQRLSDEAVDVVVQAAAGRRRRALIADLESTIIENEMLDELAEPVGARRRVAAITAAAMRGELDFREALIQRVALLEGLPEAALATVAERITLMPGAAALIDTLRRHGVATALVSGGFDVFAAPVAERLGFERWSANRLEISGGRLTGGLLEPLVDRRAKARELERLCNERSLRPDEVLAVGDGANDLEMLQAAGLGIAFRAKPAVVAAADAAIDHGDLTALLYVLGFRAEEVVRRRAELRVESPPPGGAA